MGIEFLYGWAYTPEFMAQLDRRDESGLILPGDYRFKIPDSQEVKAGLIHFSRFDKSGTEENWLWLFRDHLEARRLRLLPEVTNGPEAELISATIPIDQPGATPNIYLETIPISWLSELNLIESGISQVWLGFNHKVFIQDRVLNVSAQRLSTEEFLELCKRGL